MGSQHWCGVAAADDTGRRHPAVAVAAAAAPLQSVAPLDGPPARSTLLICNQNLRPFARSALTHFQPTLANQLTPAPCRCIPPTCALSTTASLLPGASWAPSPPLPCSRRHVQGAAAAAAALSLPAMPDVLAHSPRSWQPAARTACPAQPLACCARHARRCLRPARFTRLLRRASAAPS